MVKFCLWFCLFSHVVLPPEVAKQLPKNRLLSEVCKIRVSDYFFFIHFLWYLVNLWFACWYTWIGFLISFKRWFWFRTNGVRSGSSRAVGGSTMRFIAPSHTSCSSGGRWTISSSRRTRPSLPSDPSFQTNLLVNLYKYKLIEWFSWICVCCIC